LRNANKKHVRDRNCSRCTLQLNYRGLLSTRILLFVVFSSNCTAIAASEYARDFNFLVFTLVTRAAQEDRTAPTREARHRLSHRAIIRYPQRGKQRGNSGTLLPEISCSVYMREDASAKILLVGRSRSKASEPRASSYRQSRTR